MTYNIASLIAVLALIPAALALPLGRPDTRAGVWALLALAGAGLLFRLVGLLTGPWPTGLPASLWVSVAGTFALFVVLAARSDTMAGIGPLVLPYLLLVAVLALAWDHARLGTVRDAETDWLPLHIVASVLTYALVTLAAIAALAATLQERALKARRPTPFTRRLPAVAACEAATTRLLMAGEIVLALGIATGMALSVIERGRFLVFDHKTVLILAAFLLIGAILIAEARWGLRGKAAARAVMGAYLLITLGYPGVKFVTEVLLGRG